MQLNPRILPRVLAAGALLVQAAYPAAPPTPSAYFGHEMGADRKLLDWEKVVGYFQALAQSSDRVVVKEIGKTTEGKPMIAAWISAAATIKTLDQQRAIQEQLADPRKTSADKARELAAKGKAIVMITCSIHATEVASTHTAVEYAYRLITEDTPKHRAILDNTIFILVPSLNPDGLDIVTKWYRYALGSQWEGTNPPELYQKYVGHDNNRDWYIFSQAETRNVVSQLHNVWHPQIVYDVHQQGPYASRIFFPPWMDPIDPNVDPVLMQQTNAFGAGMAADVTATGRKGVAINAIYDFWTPARHYQAYHGGMRLLSESASVNIATPLTVKPDQILARGPGYNPRESSWNYMEPWLGGPWKLRDIVDDQLIAFESVLYQAATKREDLLRNFYEVGKRAAARTSPFAFVVPMEQADPGAGTQMLHTLHFGQVEIERAAEAFEADGKKFKAGTYVIRMQQPYSSWAKTLLERQKYPDLRQYPGGPPKQPYDVTAQTLPLLMGVKTETIEHPFRVKLDRVTVFPFIPDRIPEKGSAPGGDSDVWRVLGAAWGNSPGVFRDPATGDFYLQPVENKPLQALRRPHFAIYRTHVPSMDEGWTRWLFDTFGIPPSRIDNGDFADNLIQRMRTVIFPDQPPQQIAEGFRPGAMPADYVGGLGKGALLKDYIEQGGVVMFFNRSTDYAIEALGLKIKNVTKGLSTREYYSPGSILRVKVDNKHPIAWNLPEDVHIWSEESPAWDVPEGAGTVIARYPEKDVLASGWLLGEKYLAGKAALVEVKIGKGRAILFGMRPQYRAQSYQTFKFIFNSILLEQYPN